MRQIMYVIVNICGLAVGMFGLAWVLGAVGILPIVAKDEMNFVLTMVGAGLFGGVTSWLMSMSIGEWSLNARPFTEREGPRFEEMRALVERLAWQAGLRHAPALVIYDSADVNAFAAGPLPSRSKLIVSTSFLAKLGTSEAEAVIAQVMAKLASGDVSVLLFMHGIINVFTVFPTRIFALLLGTSLRTAEEDTPSDGVENWMKIALEIVLTPIAGLTTRKFARSAEVRADAKAAAMVGGEGVVKVLTKLAPLQATPETREMFTAPLKFAGRVRQSLRMASYHVPMLDRAAAVAAANGIVRHACASGRLEAGGADGMAARIGLRRVP